MKHTQFLKLGMGCIIALGTISWQGNQNREENHQSSSISIGAASTSSGTIAIENREMMQMRTEQRLNATLSKHVYSNASF